MLAVLADNPEPWRDAPEVGEGATVRFGSLHGMTLAGLLSPRL